jgi:acyl-homoserine lactone acylase PvdQ
VRRVSPLLALLVLALALPASSSADVSRYVLPPGNFGGIPTSPNSRDQLELYSGLTPLRRNVTAADLNKFYLPMDFKPIGETRVEPTPNPDVTITYDAYGIPHIKGKTRSAMEYGAGWVMARDRNLLFDLGRNPARAAVADIPGIDAFGLVTSATPFTPSAKTEALVTAQLALIEKTYGTEGRQMVQDMRDYAEGINAYYNAPGGPPPPVKPFDANDVIAVTAFIGSIFGAGGGREHQNSNLLGQLQKRLGATRGRGAWNDAMLSDDAESPTTIKKRFEYGPLTGGGTAGSVVVDPGSVQLVPDPRDDSARRVETPRRHASNWLMVNSQRSSTKKNLGVQGPQLGYYYPEIVYQEHLEGPGINAQGVAASGLGLYLLIGRTQNYSWSLTSAGNDNVDVFADQLCEPGGGTPTRTSKGYMFNGKCKAIEDFDAGKLGDKEVVFQRTVHGPVIGTALVKGKPYALAHQRSTFGKDGLNLAALKAMTEGKATTPQKFWDTANRFGFTFNWGYISRTTTSFFSSGLVPKRAKGLDRRLPTLGTGKYEWKGFVDKLDHPHENAGPDGLLLNWNNQAAPGWMHGDDEHYGSIFRNEMFDGWPSKPKVTDAVGIMNKAASQDLYGSKLWPVVRAMLNKGTPPDAATRRSAELVDAWVKKGAPRVGSPPGGPIPDPGAAVFGSAFSKLRDAALTPVYGKTQNLTDVIGSGATGSIVDKDLRSELGQPVKGPFSQRYCGKGNVKTCAAALWGAVKAATTELTKSQGSDPTKWRTNQGRTSFIPGLIADTTFPTTNRPTYQQVLEFDKTAP